MRFRPIVLDSAGYAAYVGPTQVGIDFGTSSKTFLMANAVFSQQPNILNGSGQLIVILLTPATQNLAFSAVAASGTFVFNYGGHASAAINWNDTAAQIQTKLQAVSGLGSVLVTGSIAGQAIQVQFAGVYGALSLATITSNSVEDGGSAPITITVTTTTAGQTIGAAITSWASQVQFFGVVADANLTEIGSTDLLAAAAILLPLNKIGFFVSNTVADVESGGMIDQLRTGGFTNTRGLYYGDSSENNDIVMMASYAGLALSTNFDGSNTTQTMHLKQLSGVQPVPTMTQTYLGYCTASGADCYISLQGDPAVFCSGANTWFDQVYGTQWLTGALQVAGYNYLAQASTKIPQTEKGMDGLKAAYQQVCAQSVTNQFAAPGAWNSATYFGNPASLVSNIAQVGYYLYSTPISQQSQANRVARVAPLVQIALKLAGAIQSSNVLVTINP